MEVGWIGFSTTATVATAAASASGQPACLLHLVEVGWSSFFTATAVAAAAAYTASWPVCLHCPGTLWGGGGRLMKEQAEAGQVPSPLLPTVPSRVESH